MSTKDRKRWLRTIAWLRKNFPAQRKITVRSAALCHQADIDLRGGRFIIHIRKGSSLDEKMDSIIHEWAHALTWFGAEQHEDHGGEWGLAYSRIYSTWCKWNYGEKEE
jgi:hypothetical protein